VTCWKDLALNAVRTSKVSQTQHQHREQRCTKHAMASLCLSNYGGKTKFQIHFKILAFPVHGNNRNESIIIPWRYNMFLPNCWLQFHNDNNNNLLVSKATVVLKQDRPSGSIYTSDIPLMIYFTSNFDNRRARLWLIKLTDWTLQRWSDDGKMYLLFRLRLRMHTLPIIFCNILRYLNW